MTKNFAEQICQNEFPDASFGPSSRQMLEGRLRLAEVRGRIHQEGARLVRMIVEGSTDEEDAIPIPVVIRRTCEVIDGFAHVELNRLLDDLTEHADELGFMAHQDEQRLSVELTEPSSELRRRIEDLLGHHLQPVVGADTCGVLRDMVAAMYAAHPHLICSKEIPKLHLYDPDLLQSSIRRLRGLFDSWSHEYGLALNTERLTGERGRPISVGLTLEPDYYPTRRKLGQLAKYKARKTIDFDGLQGHFSSVMSSEGLDCVPILKRPPPNARALIENSTWCLNAESDEPKMAAALLEAAEAGQMVHVSELIRRFDVPHERRNYINRMEGKTLTHLFKLGFFIERIPRQWGYFGIFFLDPDLRRVELLREMGLLHASTKAQQDLPFLDQVMLFDPSLFMKRVRRADAARLLKSGEREVLAAVVRHQANGSPPPVARVADETGISKNTIGWWIRRGFQFRHERGFYLRRTQSSALEGVLLAK